MNENELLRAILGLCQQWNINTQAGSAPVNTVAPVLTSSGTLSAPVATDVLSCTTGTWTKSPTGYAYNFKWEDGTSLQSGASNTYTVQNTDVGHQVHCTVTASNGSGSGTADSNSSGTVVSPPVNLTLPLIDDPLPTAQEKLYLTDGTWDVPVTITYEWEIGGVLNPFETGDTYTTSDADVGSAIRCKVTATSAGGSTSVFTAATAAVVAHATPVCVLKLYGDEVLISPVDLWTDYSGQGNNAMQNLVPNQPLLAAGPNGHLAVQFDGVDDVMTLGAINLPAATVFAVLKRTGRTGAYNVVLQAADGINGLILLAETTALTWGMFDGSNRPAGSAISSTYAIACAQRPSVAGGWSFFLNGSTDGTSSSSTGSFAQSYLGNDNFADAFQGELAALIVFNADLTSGQRDNTTNFLKAYYGL